MSKLAIIALNLFLSALLFASLELDWLAAINIILFLIWLTSSTILANSILVKIFAVPQLFVNILGFFSIIILLGFVANIFTAWLTFNNFFFLLSLIITSLILFLGSQIFSKIAPPKIPDLENGKGSIKVSNWFVFSLFILLITGWVLISSSVTGDYLSNPWQVLPFWYLLVSFLALLIIFTLAFSQRSLILTIIAVMAVSLMIHSYLLVYQEGFGGDRWRHLGSENRILNELTYQPTLLTDNLWQRQIAGFNIPQALIAGPKISYGFEWSLVMIIAKISQLSIFLIDKYLIVILWSVFLPILILTAASEIWPSAYADRRKNYLLLSAVLTLTFYPLQYYGSQTLPISFAALNFLFLISCFLAYLKNPRPQLLILIIFLTILSYFGYSLAFIILVLALIWLFSFRLKPLIQYLILALLSISIFFIELISNFSQLKSSFSLAGILRDLFIGGDFLFFATGRLLPFSINNWPVISLIISLLVGLLVLVSAFKLLKTKQKNHIFLVGLLAILVVNYALSWVFLDGLHSLSRRLNIFIVLLAVLILAWGLANLVNNRKKILITILFLGMISTLTYASGPVLEANVTTADTQAMEFVWQKIKDQPKNYCVLADTWPLLALEAYSAKEVVAGNFASDFNYQQPARVKLLTDFIRQPSLDVLNKALEITQTQSCLVVLNSSKISQELIEKINGLLGQPQTFGSNLIWQYR